MAATEQADGQNAEAVEPRLTLPRGCRGASLRRHAIPEVTVPMLCLPGQGHDALYGTGGAP
jgi:hypothetical protein